VTLHPDQVLGSVGGQAGQQHIMLQQGQSQPQIIQTTDGQTLIYQLVQVDNQGNQTVSRTLNPESLD
jgi:hypothetical protein